MADDQVPHVLDIHAEPNNMVSDPLSTSSERRVTISESSGSLDGGRIARGWNNGHTIEEDVSDIDTSRPGVSSRGIQARYDDTSVHGGAGWKPVVLDESVHDGDWKHYKVQLQQRDAILLKLLCLLRSNGIQLPSDVEQLEKCLKQVAVTTDLPPIDEAAVEEVAMDAMQMLRQGSVLWKNKDVSLESIFTAMQAVFPRANRTTVSFSNLTYKVTRQAGEFGGVVTVGSKAVSTAKGLMCLKLIKRILGAPPPAEVFRKLVDTCTGSLRSGEMTLVMGPPGCGKSSLLKVIAGQLPLDAHHTQEGEVLYNGRRPGPDTFFLPKLVAFVPQQDNHVPLMSVEETLDFAFKSLEGGQHMRWTAEKQLDADQKEFMNFMDERNGKIHIIMKLLGISHVAETPVGDVAVRGVSGGERRRVTLGEMLAGSQDVFLLDSISNGLDSSTTYDIIHSLGKAVQCFGTTVAVVLLQPPPEVYNLFNKVILMAEGRICYEGPPSQLLAYFAGLGFKCPPRKDVADFAVGVTTEEGSAYLMSPGELAEAGIASPPKNAQEFGDKWLEYFKNTKPEEYARIANKAGAGGAISVGDIEKKEEHARTTSAGSAGGSARVGEVPSLTDTTENGEYAWPESQKNPYAGTWMYHYRLCRNKHWGLLKKDIHYLKTTFGTTIMVAVVIGSIYYKLPLSEVNSKFGLLFFSLLYLCFQSNAQLPAALELRKVFYKQVTQGFYPPSADVLANIAVQFVPSTLAACMFAPIIYFMTGLSTADHGARFFLFMVNVIACALNLSGFFRFLAAAMPNFPAAQGFASLSIINIIIWCGYLVPETEIPDVFIWIYWLNPIAWAFRAVVVNEFTSPQYDICSVSVAPGEACPSSLGASVMTAYGFRQDNYWRWVSVIFMMGQWLITAVLTGLVYAKVRWDASDATVIPGPPPEHPLLGMGKAPSKERLPADTEGSSLLTPVTLAFSDVTYNVPHPSGDGTLLLLDGVDGYCKPGTVTALMGSSGAGKTTLLDVLAGRKTSGTIGGKITVNGNEPDKNFARTSGYVEQMDVHSPSVTVRETVMFSAAMRLEEADWPRDKRIRFVDDMLKMLGLDDIEDRVIGGAEGGLLADERKRVTFAVELVGRPSLLFLDEPTTGLDARAAQVVLRAIKKIAALGCTVICTIHQPSTYLFEQFDALLLLKRGGQTVFFGPLGENCSNLIENMSAVPGSVPIKPNANPATWMLENIGAGTSGKGDAQVFASWYKESRAHQDVRAELQSLQSVVGEKKVYATLYASGLRAQFVQCVKRSVRQYWRSPNYNYLRLTLAVLQAILFSCSFVGQELTTEAQVSSILGCIYMTCNFAGAVGFNFAVPFFSVEKEVMYREQSSKMYSIVPYTLSYTVAELPYILGQSILTVIIFYFMAGLEHDAGKFFWFYLFFTLNTAVMVFLGHAVTACVPSGKEAMALGGVINSIFSLFGGFMISPAAIPSYWLWAFWLTPIHYAVEGLVTTQFHDNYNMITLSDGTQTTIAQYVNDFFGGKYQFAHRFYDLLFLFCAIAVTRWMFMYGAAYIRWNKR